MNNQEVGYTYSEIEEFILNYRSGDAIKLLVSLLNNNKSNDEILFEKVMIYYYIELDLNKALKELDNLLKINPTYIDALLLKGEILAGIHKYGKAINILDKIHPKILPYGYKKLIEYISEYNHRRTGYYSVYDFDSYVVYFYIESQFFKRLTETRLNYLEEAVFEYGLIWQNLDEISYEENIPIISGTRLSEEEHDEKSKINKKNCIICGKKLKKNQKNLCKSCMKKQYASRIIKKLVSVVKPEMIFKKQDLKSLNLDDIQIQDYIWTLQEFDLIEVDNNKFKLKNETILNNFRIDSKMDPIDFDSLNDENMLNKTCKICGKTLPLSHFYKSSNGYEDNCKICKKLMVTAKYLEDLIKYVGFENEFDESDLKDYIPNQNQIMGMIWSLQDNDLLIEKEDKKYVLVDKSECLSFLEKYDSNYDINEVDIKSKSKVKRKSKSKSKDKQSLDKSNVVPKLDVIKANVKSKSDLKSLNDKKKSMDIVLKARKDGKTREEAADIAKIPLYKINHWYKEGKQGFGKENISFYRKLKRIEDDLKYSFYINERKQMNFVLKLLRQGKSKKEIVKLTELSESTITSWYNQGKDGYSRNTVYFYGKVQEINEANKKKDMGKNLKVQLKEFIHKFRNLDKRIVDTNVKSTELNDIRIEIEHNITILKESSKLRRIDKLESRLLNAKKSYKELNNRFNVELENINHENIKCEELISENACRIIDLRKEFSNNYSVLDELSEISFSNSKLNANLKNGNDIDYNEILDLESRLNNIESNSKSQFNDGLNNSSNIKGRSNIQDLLKFLYSITGTNDTSLKVSFVHYLTLNHLSVKEGKEIREKIKNEIDECSLKTSDEIQLRLDELIKEKSLVHTDELKDFLYSLTGRYVIKSSFWTKFSVERELYEVDVKIIRRRVVEEIYSGKLKSNKDIELRIRELINEVSLNKNQLLKYIGSIKCWDEKRIPTSDCIEIKNKLKTEVNLEKLYTIEQIDSKYNELAKQKVSESYVLINKFYSIIGREEIKSSFFNEFLTYNLDTSDTKDIREIILEEIKSFKLKSKEEINLRINELINQNKKVKCNVLLEELYTIVGKNNLSDSFLKRLSDNGLTEDFGNYIKRCIEDKIKNYTIKSKLEINDEINKLITEEMNRQNKSINKLNELFLNDNIYLRELSSSEREEIKVRVIKSIKENRLDYLSVYSEFKKVIEEFKKTKNVDESIDSTNEDTTENDENKSSEGFISKLKRFFSRK